MDIVALNKYIYFISWQPSLTCNSNYFIGLLNAVSWMVVIYYQGIILRYYGIKIMLLAQKFVPIVPINFTTPFTVTAEDWFW